MALCLDDAPERERSGSARNRIRTPTTSRAGVSPPPFRRCARSTATRPSPRFAYRLSEVIAIFPITPSSAMGEQSDEWAAGGMPNLWGTVPQVAEMQSEGGAAGAVHGAIQAGAMATTFTASQGLLLMIPNMFKIAGELLPFVMHVSARTLATHALSIFGDHSDVMACRGTGFAMLCGRLGAGGPGPLRPSRTPPRCARAFPSSTSSTAFAPRTRWRRSPSCRTTICAPSSTRPPSLSTGSGSLSPDHPVLRGTAQNPDTFFQAREAANPYYLACPGRAPGNGPLLPRSPDAATGSSTMSVIPRRSG